MLSPLLQDLNPPQREAVLHDKGPLLIFAGAGSGKTNVLTKRIAYLIRERCIRPYNILAVTFTNKAAGEMKARIALLVGDTVAKELWAGTFHSLCARMLRERGKEIGISSTFAIYDDSDQVAVVKEVLKENDYDEKQYQPRAILNHISKAKEALETVSDLNTREWATPFDRVVATVYMHYQEKLVTSNALDFDDLIMKAVELLTKSEKAREHYQTRFHYVLCDEFQDTNESQYKLLQLLTAKHHNLCVVGDDDQSIYAFRGAKVQIILEGFPKDYPNTVTIKLEQNYRSTKTILDAANHVVKHNRGRSSKHLWTDKTDGEPIFLLEATTEQEEASAVAGAIKTAVLAGTRGYKDHVVLYRTNAQSRAIEEQLINTRVPYKIVGGLRFYERREIKDILAYLRLAVNPYDTVSLKRVINVPSRNIGISTVDKMAHFARAREMTLWDGLARAAEADLSPRSRQCILGFVKMVQYFQAQVDVKPVSSLVEDVISTVGYIEELKKDHTPDCENRIENVGELINVARQFELQNGTDGDMSLSAFLEQVALVADIDSVDASADSVTLMTLHAAKGLEFPVVFLVGMEESVFPHIRSFGNPAEIEEERRLCYVGITRARELLYMSFAESRMTFGNIQRNPVSRFVSEIPMVLFLPKSVRPSATESSFALATGSNGKNSEPAGWREISRRSEIHALDTLDLGYKLGDKVVHAAFGTGTVVSITPSNEDALVTVAFPAPTGIKKLMASFARLQKAGV
jgi:DNA helicase-2/ATP-dependent DNA helicase PcrA